MYHFNENNLITGYIKELLHNFNLPTCEVFVPNQTVIYPDTNYIYNDFLVKTRSNVSVGVYDDIIINRNVSTDMADYVCSYVFGSKIPNITKTLKLNSILYDTYTHEYLGNYLRFIRDTKGLDLMMLYNCFSDRLVTNLIYNDFNADNLKYKIYAVPIKFDKKYLIGIDTDSPLELACGLFDGNVQVTSVNTGNDDTENSLYKLSHKIFNATSLNDPIEYFVSSVDLNDNVLLKKYERCLTLFIKIPTQNKSTISIIEVSDFMGQFKQHVDGSLPELALPMGSNFSEYPTKLSLFKINDNISYPFAVRLLEFLFGQTIDPTEQIGENIERIQEQLISVKQYYANGVRLRRVGAYGVWSNDIRDTIYRAVTKDRSLREVAYPDGSEARNRFINSRYDLTCYVDKDVEELITVTSK